LVGLAMRYIKHQLDTGKEPAFNDYEMLAALEEEVKATKDVTFKWRFGV
jgi:hypothetical protein